MRFFIIVKNLNLFKQLFITNLNIFYSYMKHFFVFMIKERIKKFTQNLDKDVHFENK